MGACAGVGVGRGMAEGPDPLAWPYWLLRMPEVPRRHNPSVADPVWTTVARTEVGRRGVGPAL